MKNTKNKDQDSATPYSEEEIQSEIRRRIFEESQKREEIKDAKESTEATLDALEKMVHLSREEMEKIAEEVRKDYATSSPKKQKTSTFNWLFPWATLLLIFLTFFLLRKGSSWVLISGLILLFIVINVIREYFTDDNS